MSTSTGDGGGSRQDRRKLVTRARILAAAERLFGERGYGETSIDDIAAAADVGVRTIYTHFASKAAIMLAAFDAWVDDFVVRVMARPVDEPVRDAVRAALAEMAADGWPDHDEDGSAPAHPMVGHLFDGSLDVAGHVLQRWMREIDRLAADAAARGSYPRGSLEPRARAVAVFAAWIGSLSAAGALARGVESPEGATGHGLGLGVLEAITSGRI